MRSLEKRRERSETLLARRRKLWWVSVGFAFALVLYQLFGTIRFSMVASFLIMEEVIQQTSMDVPQNSKLVVESIPDATNLDSPNDCFAPNSEAWLNGPRFLNDTETNVDEKSIRFWAVRLAYLAIHYHQHKHAIAEASARYGRENNGNCSSRLKTRGIGKFDYECPNAKHLVILLTKNGLGINIRGGTTPGVVAALSSDRVLHVLNNIKFETTSTTSKDLKERVGSWPWASCDRRDFQCVFMPPSPCALTHDDITNGYLLTDEEGRLLATKGIPPAGHEDDKVWISPFAHMPLFRGIPKPASSHLNKTIHELIDPIPETDPRLVAMRMAADSLLEKEEKRKKFHYYMDVGRVEHATVIYSARLNLRNTQKMDAAIAESVPKNHDVQSTIGVPVRGSDKCSYESECMSYQKHMEAASHLWTDHLELTNSKVTKPTIVFTTESKAIAKEHVDFSSNTTALQSLPHKFDFITNLRDRHPDSGAARKVNKALKGTNISLDDAMVDVMSTLKLQMLPRVTMVNCCSNYHSMLSDFLVEGCGAAAEHSLHCIQDHPDPQYIICCYKNRTDSCRIERQKLIDAQNKTRKV